MLKKLILNLDELKGVESHSSNIKIKDKSLVSAHTNGKSKSTITVIRKKSKTQKDETYLSDVLQEMPAGIIHKDETGMGATHMELLSKRHSIIVEPIKVTASHKAYTTSFTTGDHVLYVGSPTSLHPKKITKQTILRYLNNPKIQYKKIIVVADSLKKVIDAAGPTVFKSYFILLDEADSFQMDSTFRKSMEQCMDFYKQFSPNKRAMVSATMIDFSDPDLAKEHRTYIKYDQEKPRKISLLQTDINNLNGIVYDEIAKKIKNYPNDKIVVAYNSVTMCGSLIDRLVTDGLATKKEVSILCSKNSQDRVKDYYKELESELLPNKLCFMTSAYFTGFDLKEQYHLITVSSIRNFAYTLSERRIKQIAGRCRVSLLSETIIHDSKPKDPKKDKTYTTKSLIKAAQSQIDAFTCMYNHYKKHHILYQSYDAISSLILKTLNNNRISYIRRDEKTGAYKISYLTIDAVVEGNKTRFLVYDQSDKLTNTLKQIGHKVTSKKGISNTTIDIVENISTSREESVKEAISYLRTNPSFAEIDYKLNTEKLAAIQKTILQMYLKLALYIEPDSFIDKIEEAAFTKDSRKLQNLEIAATIGVLPNSNFLKNRLKHYIRVGNTYTSSNLRSCLSHALTESGIINVFFTDKRAIELVRLVFTTKRNPKKGEYTITGENPYELEIESHMKEVDGLAQLRILFQL